MSNYGRAPQVPTAKAKANKNSRKSSGTPAVRMCSICHAGEVEWTMQPNGPGEDIVFTFPGSHYRGFMAVNICDACHSAVNRGERVEFAYRGVPYVIVNLQLQLR